MIGLDNLLLALITVSNSMLKGWIKFGSMVNNFYEGSIASGRELPGALVDAFQELILDVVPLADSFNTYANLNHTVTDPRNLL